MNSMIYVLIAFVIIFSAYYLNVVKQEPFKIVKTYEEYFENPPPFSDTNAVVAPNIPVDPETTHHIGGMPSTILDKPLVPETGKYVFPKFKLLYDGIWEEVKEITGNVERKTWKLTKTSCDDLIRYTNMAYAGCEQKLKTNLSPVHSTYGAEHFLLLPEKDLPVIHYVPKKTQVITPNHTHCPLDSYTVKTDALPFFGSLTA